MNQVPEALYRCTTEARKDGEVGDDIPTFESNVMVSKRAQAEKVNVSDDEELDDLEIYDTFDEINMTTGRKGELNPPLEIYIHESVSAQRCHEFCREVLEKKDRGNSRLVETYDGILRRIEPDDETYLQIVVSLVLQKRILKISQHAKLAVNTRKIRLY